MDLHGPLELLLLLKEDISLRPENLLLFLLNSSLTVLLKLKAAMVATEDPLLVLSNMLTSILLNQRLLTLTLPILTGLESARQ